MHGCTGAKPLSSSDHFGNILADSRTAPCTGSALPAIGSMQAFVEIAAEVAQGFRDVGSDEMLVDAMTARMTLKRGTLDTIVTANLHPDAEIAALRKSGTQSP
jgi:hypothetical protein